VKVGRGSVASQFECSGEFTSPSGGVKPPLHSDCDATRAAERLTAPAREEENVGMAKFCQAAWFVALSVMTAAPIAPAQVPERRPSPPIDPDWTYTSPGPAKCVEIGNVYLHKKDLKGALSRFQEAVKDNPHYAPAYLGLGKVYEKMHQKQKALDAYQRYLDELPSAQEASEAKKVNRIVARLQSELARGKGETK
jgi:tetratricopeptide (TPR) repeat protein